MRRPRAVLRLPSLLLMLAAPLAAQPPESGAPEVRRAYDLGGLEARSAALVLSGQAGGEIGIDVLAVPVATESPAVGLVIDIDGPSLLAAAGEEAGELLTEVYAYALCADDRLVAFFTQAFTLDRTTDAATLEAGGVKFFGHLDLPPEECSLRILVLQRQTGRLGLRAVPYSPTAPPPPVVADDPARWVPVRISAQGGSEPAFPWLVGGEAVFPSARGRPAEAAEEAVAATAPAVTRPAGGESGLSALARTYLEALDALAGGDSRKAQTVLIGAESQAFDGDRSMKKQVRSTNEMLTVASWLTRLRTDSVVPIIALHEELYRRYHRERHFQLATHSREMVLGLASIYRQLDETPESRTLIADSLVSLGGYLLSINSAQAARQIFQLSGEYAPAHAPSLYCLAAIDEAYGNYKESVQRLRKVVEARPDLASARLRLAVNLARTGRSGEAAKLFERGRRHGPAWIRAVAVEELARLRIGQGRPAEAVELLHETLAAGTEESAVPGLRLQLAATLDRMGRPKEAQRVLAELDLEPRPEMDSPRLVYERWPDEPFAESRLRLEDASARHLGALEDALARLSPLAKDPRSTGLGG